MLVDIVGGFSLGIYIDVKIQKTNPFGLHEIQKKGYFCAEFELEGNNGSGSIHWVAEAVPFLRN